MEWKEKRNFTSRLCSNRSSVFWGSPVPAKRLASKYLYKFSTCQGLWEEAWVIVVKENVLIIGWRYDGGIGSFGGR